LFVPWKVARLLIEPTLEETDHPTCREDARGLSASSKLTLTQAVDLSIVDDSKNALSAEERVSSSDDATTNAFIPIQQPLQNPIEGPTRIEVVAGWTQQEASYSSLPHLDGIKVKVQIDEASLVSDLVDIEEGGGSQDKYMLSGVGAEKAKVGIFSDGNDNDFGTKWKNNDHSNTPKWEKGLLGTFANAVTHGVRGTLGLQSQMIELFATSDSWTQKNSIAYNKTMDKISSLAKD
jgi:hypothetical protein